MMRAEACRVVTPGAMALSEVLLRAVQRVRAIYHLEIEEYEIVKFLWK
jgi:hypothetical protein